jgi:hypothetical protein
MAAWGLGSSLDRNDAYMHRAAFVSLLRMTNHSRPSWLAPFPVDPAAVTVTLSLIRKGLSKRQSATETVACLQQVTIRDCSANLFVHSHLHFVPLFCVTSHCICVACSSNFLHFFPQIFKCRWLFHCYYTKIIGHKILSLQVIYFEKCEKNAQNTKCKCNAKHRSRFASHFEFHEFAVVQI